MKRKTNPPKPPLSRTIQTDNNLIAKRITGIVLLSILLIGFLAFIILNTGIAAAIFVVSGTVGLYCLIHLIVWLLTSD